MSVVVVLLQFANGCLEPPCSYLSLVSCDSVVPPSRASPRDRTGTVFASCSLPHRLSGGSGIHRVLLNQLSRENLVSETPETMVDLKAVQPHRSQVFH